MPLTGVSESGDDFRSTFRRFVCRYIAVSPGNLLLGIASASCLTLRM